LTREEIFGYVKKKYGSTPEYLWEKWPQYAVLRHADNRKWYAAIMNVSADRLGLPGGDTAVEIIDVKCDPQEADFLRRLPGYLPGYHMDHQNWLTVLLDGTVPDLQVLDLLDASYSMTGNKKQDK